MTSLDRTAISFALLVLALPVAAQAAPSGCDDISSIPITDNVDYWTDIKAGILAGPSQSCADCHSAGNPGGGLDLSDSSQSPPSIEAVAQLVIERKPRESLFFNKINCDDPGDFGSRMPFAGGKLTPAEQALIYDWITQGARGLNPDGNEISDTVFRAGMESTRID